MLYLSRGDISYIKWGKLVFHCHFISSLARVYLQSRWLVVENKWWSSSSVFCQSQVNKWKKTVYPTVRNWNHLFAVGGWSIMFWHYPIFKIWPRELKFKVLREHFSCAFQPFLAPACTTALFSKVKNFYSTIQRLAFNSIDGWAGRQRQQCSSLMNVNLIIRQQREPSRGKDQHARLQRCPVCLQYSRVIQSVHFFIAC